MTALIKKSLFFTVSVLIVISGLALTHLLFFQFSTLAWAFTKAVLAISLFVAVDSTLLSDINTIEQLKKGNIAYALVILSYALLVGLCVSTA